MEHSAQVSQRATVVSWPRVWWQAERSEQPGRGELSAGQTDTHSCLLAACPHIFPLLLSTIFLSLKLSPSLFILPTLNGFGKNYRHTKMLKSSLSSSLVSQTPQGTAHTQAQRCRSPGSSQTPAAPEKAGPGAVQCSTPGCRKAGSWAWASSATNKCTTHQTSSALPSAPTSTWEIEDYFTVLIFVVCCELWRQELLHQLHSCVFFLPSEYLTAAKVRISLQAYPW